MMKKTVSVLMDAQQDQAERLYAAERAAKAHEGELSFYREVLAAHGERMLVLEGKMAELVIVLDMLRPLDPEVTPHLWPELVLRILR